MAFTKVKVVGHFETETGAADSAGTVTFTLTQPMANAGVVIVPKPVVVTLNSEGKLEVELLATNDPETVPQGVLYGVTEQITGAQPRDYCIEVPHEEGEVNLASLMPGETAWT